MTEVRLNTPTERALYRDCERYKAERDALREAASLAWEAGFWAGVEAVRRASYDVAMPDDWVQQASDASAR